MERIILKNGFIADGTGEEGYVGNVLIEGNKIKAVSKTPIDETNCKVIDCTGKVIAPGFIDSHSHQDRVLHYDNDLIQTEPYVRQGITTYVAGNCGFGCAGIEKDSKYNKEVVYDANYPDRMAGTLFNTYEEYFKFMEKRKMRQNMAVMAAHGVAAGSVCGVDNPETVTPEVQKRIAYLLEEGLYNGCKGISFGLGYRPGNYFTDEQVRETSEIAIKRDKLITVHPRVMSVSEPVVEGKEPENVKWTREFIDLFKDSGARLQMSHLQTCGRTAWPSYKPLYKMFDEKVKTSGVDVWFDMYSYTQGFSEIQILLPPTTLDPLRKAEGNPQIMNAINEHMKVAYAAVGMPVEDVQLCDGIVPEYKKYDGWFMDKIMADTGMTTCELYWDLYKKTNGYARIYFYIEQDPNNIPDQMCNPRGLYMTDACIAPNCHPIMTAYGTMPHFLALARESKKQTMEMTVAKMTGRAAVRFDLTNRGFIREGYYADVTVFDWNTIDGTSTPEKPDQEPIGIEHVFVNGAHLLDHGKFDAEPMVGMMIR